MGPRLGEVTNKQDWNIPIRKLRVVYATPFELRHGLERHELRTDQSQLARIIEPRGMVTLALRKKLYTRR